VLAEATAILKKEPPVTISSIEVKTSPTSLAETLQHYGPFCAENGILLCLEPNLSTDGWQEELRVTVSALSTGA
jgi:hypothetical protein